MIGAILRAQLLSMRPRTGRGGGLAFSSITGLIFYGFWAFLGWGAMLFFSSPNQAPFFVPVITSGLAFVMLYWQLAPIISASFGASLDLRKLLAYPIPHGKLFLIEILLRITTCGEMVVLLGGAAIGLLRNPLYGLHAAPYIFSGAILFATTNILLSAGARSWIERLFVRTRLKEVMIFVLVIGGLVPQMLVYLNVKRGALMRFAPSQLVWPWAAAGRLMLHDPIWTSALTALAWLAAAFVFSRYQFERSLTFDAASVRRPERAESTDGLVDRLFRLPSRFLADPIAVLVEKELRTLARIPRFRLVYAMSCFFGIVLYLPSLRRGHNDTFFHQNALPFMALYGLLMLGQITYWNAFGFDRSAVQGYFSWPVPFRDVLIAKNIAVVCLLIPQILIVSLIGRAVHLPASPGKVLETIVVMVISSLYWLAMGNIFSVRMPRPLDPDKMNQMSNKMQALTIWVAPLLLLPLALAYWSRWFFENEFVFIGIMAIAAIVGGVFYWVGLDSAVNTAQARRESILMTLSRSDSPMSIT
jgi:ABC-2 type transport system permease protein